VQKIKIEVPGTGDICGYSSFDLSTFEDEDWEGGISVRRGGIGEVNAESKSKASTLPKARLGKLEKSFMNFTATHPNWQCSASGKDLLDRVESFRIQQEKAFAAEKAQHIEAAARQLETLRQLEVLNEEEEEVPTNGHHTIDDYYISQSGLNNDAIRELQQSLLRESIGPGSVPGASLLSLSNCHSRIVPRDQ